MSVLSAMITTAISFWPRVDPQYNVDAADPGTRPAAASVRADPDLVSSGLDDEFTRERRELSIVRASDRDPEGGESFSAP